MSDLELFAADQGVASWLGDLIREHAGKPWLLDLFCCEGGAAEGYLRAGWAVVGVDKLAKFARRYPPARPGGGGGFVAADALTFARRYGHLFNAIHASPPCQPYTIATAGNLPARTKHDRLIAATRDLLVDLGKPWVIENVAQARSEMRDPVQLCGTMFKLHATDDDGTPLEMWRHRLFEASFPIAAPGDCAHGWHSPQVAGSYGGARRDKDEARHVRHGGYVPSKPVQQRLLGIDWMTQYGLYQSLPPVYTEWIGKRLLEVAA